MRTAHRSSSEHTSISNPVFYLFVFVRDRRLCTNSYMRYKLAGISGNMIRGCKWMTWDDNPSIASRASFQLTTLITMTLQMQQGIWRLICSNVHLWLTEDHSQIKRRIFTSRSNWRLRPYHGVGRPSTNSMLK